jgi:hypothetical protein
MAVEANLDGLFKEVYEDWYDLVPRSMLIQQRVPFDTANKIGRQYVVDVMLQDENGATYQTQAVDSSTAFALNDAIGGVELPAKINSSELVMRSWLSYQQASRATSGGKAAFLSATEDRFRNNLSSCRKRVELSLIAGGSGASAGGLGTTASSTNASATTTNVVITAATWAPGIWAGLKGTKLNFYDNGVIVSSGADAIFTLTTVTSSSRTLLITGTATGITALDSAISSDPTQVKAFFQGAYGEEATGLIEIAKNTSTLFNIDAGTYDLWKGNSETLSGAPTMGKFLQGIAEAVGRGLDMDGVLLVSPYTWNDLNGNEAALRVYDSSWKRGESENGTESITYYSQNGKVEVVPYIYMKAGEALFFVPEQCRRIGSVDVTYSQPGRGGRIFFDIPAYAGYEFRSYSDQSILSVKPATLIHYSGFTNQSGP